MSLCRVFLRNDVAALMVVNVAVVFVARANVAVALYILLNNEIAGRVIVTALK